MTEEEIFDKLNPRRDLPQATCDIISLVYKTMNAEVEQAERIKHDEQVKELQEKDRKIEKLTKENEQLKKNAIVWHKQSVDSIYKSIDDWSVHCYICRMKDGSLNIATGSADEGCNGAVGRSIYFEINDEKYSVDDIDKWLEIPKEI